MPTAQHFDAIHLAHSSCGWPWPSAASGNAVYQILMHAPQTPSGPKARIEMRWSARSCSDWRRRPGDGGERFIQPPGWLRATDLRAIEI